MHLYRFILALFSVSLYLWECIAQSYQSSSSQGSSVVVSPTSSSARSSHSSSPIHLIGNETSIPKAIKADKKQFAVYWGQSGRGEKRLAYYCDQKGVDIVILSFIADYTGGYKKSPVLDLSSNCENVEQCTEVEKDIQHCQSKDVKVFLSLGGATGPYHTQKWDPDLMAWWIWNKYLSGTDETVSRPFGSVVLDGIDLDPEETDGKGYDKFIDTLRKLSSAHFPARELTISAAPQCSDLDPYTRNAMYNTLYPNKTYDAYPDIVFVQFYNNYCSASASSSEFNFDRWNKWAAEHASRRRTKVFLGVLGKNSRGDTGYVDFNRLSHIMQNIQDAGHFGGVMVWDAHAVYDNRVPHLNIQYGEAISSELAKINGRLSSIRSSVMNGTVDEPSMVFRLPRIWQVTLEHLTKCTGKTFVLKRSTTNRALLEALGYLSPKSQRYIETSGIDLMTVYGEGTAICIEEEIA